MGLSAEEMVEAGELINLAFLSVFSNSQTANHSKLLQFSFSLIKEESPHVLFSGETRATKRLVDLMYNDPLITDFVMKIGFHFYAKLGNTPDRYAALVANLACGLGVVKPEDTKEKPSLVAMPQESFDRMASTTEVEMLLSHNSWMTTIAMMMLYLMTPDDLSAIRKLKTEAEKLAAQSASRK